MEESPDHLLGQGGKLGGLALGRLTVEHRIGGHGLLEEIIFNDAILHPDLYI